MCMCLYIERWFTLVDYMHDAYWLYYLHQVRCASLCIYGIISTTATSPFKQNKQSI